MRPLCAKCNRPLPVCLCPELPPEPIPTATRVLILQHPHETRHKLATVPVLSRCLSNCGVIVGRRLQQGSSQLLDQLSSIPPSHPLPLPLPSTLSFTDPQSTVGATEHSELRSPVPPPVHFTSEAKDLDPIPSKSHSIKDQEPCPPSLLPPPVVHCTSEAEDLNPNPCNNHSTEWKNDSDPSPSSVHSRRWAEDVEPQYAVHSSTPKFEKQELPTLPFLSIHSPSLSGDEYQDPDPPPLAGERDAEWRCPSCQRRKRVLLLFPTPAAVELRSWMSHQKKVIAQIREVEEDPDLESNSRGYCEYGECSGGHVILLVVDGTWQHAREMVAASMLFLAAGQSSVEQVCLPHDVTRESEGLAIRKEPFAGCLTTIEAVARALAILEPHPHGLRVQNALLSVLQRMVGLQAAHIFAPSKHPRPRSSSAPAVRRQRPPPPPPVGCPRVPP